MVVCYISIRVAASAERNCSWMQIDIKMKKIFSRFTEQRAFITSYVFMLFCCTSCLTAKTYINEILCIIQEHAIADLSEYWLACLIMITAIGAGYYLYAKTRENNLYIQHRYVAIATFVTLFYSYYRMIDGSFVFWGLIHNGHCFLAYTDTLYVLYALLLIRCKAYKRRVEDNPVKRKMLLDTPINDVDDDFFGYNKMAMALLSDLRTTDVSKRGFTVGITGKWGIGKSSFLNLFEKLIQDSGDIVVRFYPRSSESYKQISSDFFSVLSEELSQYHTGVVKMLGKYARSIRSLEGEGWINRTFDAFENWSDDDDKARIETAIGEIGRKIFIIIEDLDRLTAKEILEVLKLTDRNGNFRNTFFITAYDKDYANSVLRHYLGYDRSQVFTDKYFNYEIALPAHNIHTERNYVRRYLTQQVAFEEQDAITKAELLDAWDNIGDEVIRALGVMRHVKRFLNIFMSRYPNVKNDVDVKDFLRLTLLRYKDIEAYYMLSEADIVVRGNFITSGSESVVYQMKDVESYLSNRQNGWDGTLNLLNKLFPKQETKETYNLDSDYKKIMMVNSFDLYFFDEMVGKLYHKELSRLFVEEDENMAVSLLREMVEKDEKSVEEYLRSRNMRRLATQHALNREMLLLMELYKLRRNINNQSSLVWLMNSEAAKEAVEHGVVGEKEEYQNIIQDLLKELINDYPIEVGGLLLLHVEEYQHRGASELLLSRNQYVELAIWCQRIYFSKFGEENWNLSNALRLSDIKMVKGNELVVVEDARKELKAFMELHADYFAKMIVHVNVSRIPKSKTITFSFIDEFNPDHFFPVQGFEFTDWVNGCIDDEDTKFVIRRLYDECADGKCFSIPNIAGQDCLEGFESFASVIRDYDADETDDDVLEYLRDNISTDLEGIASGIRREKSDVQASIKRLAAKGLIQARLTLLKDKMDAFHIGDFVMLPEVKFQNMEGSLLYSNNVFRITDIDTSGARLKYKLDTIDDWLEQYDILAIPIDGTHDRDIYYDPIIAASVIAPGQPIPVHHTDYSYYMDHFSRFTYKDKSYVELVNEANCQFVHEVQHYMREELGGCELKINHRVRTNSI